MKLDMYRISAFASQPFAGNPAAIIPLLDWLPDDLMQNIARENNLSETAFIVPLNDGEWHIRWFSPVIEVPLCGHATLAAATVIDFKHQNLDWPISFMSASGPLSVSKEEELYVLDLPTQRPEVAAPSDNIKSALNISNMELWHGGNMYMAVLDQESEVDNINPDFEELKECVPFGIAVTAPGNDCDFVSRFFAPSLGINEDPVTGSAHSVLTPYWIDRIGENELKAKQISSRGGEVICRYGGDRTYVGGKTTLFFSGVIRV